MDQGEISKILVSTLKGIFDAFLIITKSLPWWVWIVITIIILMKIFNNLMRQEKFVSKRSYDSQLGLFFINLYYFLFQRGKVIKSGINEIDKMSGKDFEFYLKYLFDRLGYKATRVGTSASDRRGDFGGDVIIEKDGIRTAIQAKCYNNRPVGIDAVREVMGAMQYYKCSKAMVVTNSNFTNDAITMAQVSGVELWNRNKLIDTIASVKQ